MEIICEGGVIIGQIEFSRQKNAKKNYYFWLMIVVYFLWVALQPNKICVIRFNFRMRDFILLPMVTFQIYLESHILVTKKQW